MGPDPTDGGWLGFHHRKSPFPTFACIIGSGGGKFRRSVDVVGWNLGMTRLRFPSLNLIVEIRLGIEVNSRWLVQASKCRATRILHN